MEEKKKVRTKERNRERDPNPAIWKIWSPLTTRMDPTVGILTPYPQGDKRYLIHIISERRDPESTWKPF